MNRVTQQPLAAFAVAVIGVGALSLMDAVMKGLVLDIGTFPTMAWRALAAAIALAPIYLAMRREWPARATLRIHLVRAVILVPMGFLFFWGLAFVPMAQAIALAFIAPLIALMLAAALDGERLTARALTGSVMALAGVSLIFIAQSRAELGREALLGSAAILGSALLYAFNIILMRRQAQAAGPLEIAFFQFAITAILFWLIALAVGVPPPPAGQLGPLAAATVLSVAGMMLLAWAYARAGAGYLSNSEYSGFIWAAIFGWLFFGEAVSGWTAAGAAAIIAGCIVAVRPGRSEHPAIETAA